MVLTEKKTLLSDTQLTAAIDTPLIAHVVQNEVGSGFFNAATAMLVLAIEEHRFPGARAGAVAKRLCEQLDRLVVPGNEPFLDLGPFWAYSHVSLAVGIAKVTPTVWDALCADTRSRLDLLMRATACLFNFGTNANNKYTTGPGLGGNFNKDWNPNYRLACIVPMFGVYAFFGSRQAVDDVLLSFDYDAYLEEFRAAGFTNILSHWKVCGADLMMKGGDAMIGPDRDKYAGTGVGVRTPYVYRSPERKEDYTLDEIGKIFDAIVSRTFDGGVVVADSSGVPNGVYEDGTPKAYTMKDGDKNPVLGKVGMMTEFNGGDGGGYRSSLAYCHHDFVVTTATMAALDELDLWHPADFPETFARAEVGQTDLIYKCKMGYRSFSIGHGYDSGEESFGGYFMLLSIWYHDILGQDADV